MPLAFQQSSLTSGVKSTCLNVHSNIHVFMALEKQTLTDSKLLVSMQLYASATWLSIRLVHRLWVTSR